MAAEPKTWRIAVANRKNVRDAVGDGLRGDMLDLGINGIERVRSVRLYALHGELSPAELDRIIADLLVDAVMQEHLKIDDAGLPVASGQWGVEVWFRRGVTDAVGETTLKASRDLGVTGIESVDTGRGYILAGQISRSQTDTICRRLLANDVIETCVCYQGGK